MKWFRPTTILQHEAVAQSSIGATQKLGWGVIFSSFMEQLNVGSRNIRIDTLRGLACIFLVAFHVVGAFPDQGLRVAEGFYRGVADSLVYIRMPLFTFISGIVYAYRPVGADISGYIGKKIRRIIIPLLVVGTLFALLQSFIPGTSRQIENWFMLHIIPVGQYWFLEAIFLIFLFMIPLEKLKIFDQKWKFLAVFLGSIILFLSPIDIPYFAISNAFYLLPFFLIGASLQRFLLIGKLTPWFGALLLAIAAFLVMKNYSVIVETISARHLLSLAVGMSACIGLLALGLRITPLALIGYYSYSIYLFHVFFTASSKMALMRLGVMDINILFWVGLTMGIFGPIIAELILKRHALTRVGFLGKSAT